MGLRRPPAHGFEERHFQPSTHAYAGRDYKTAWFMSHRIPKECARPASRRWAALARSWRADETYIGSIEGHAGSALAPGLHKNMVLTLVERGGSARSFHTDGRSIASIVPIVRQNIRRESRLMTDKALHYRAVGKEFAEQASVNTGPMNTCAATFTATRSKTTTRFSSAA